MKTTIKLSLEELVLLRESLDSHEYWQLADASERSSGYTTLEDDDLANHENGDEIRACRALADRLSRIINKLDPPADAS